ncbi:MAG: hypothetical protein ACTSVV_17855 [Promethearchaeota archaeon]
MEQNKNNTKKKFPPLIHKVASKFLLILPILYAMLLYVLYIIYLRRYGHFQSNYLPKYIVILIRDLSFLSIGDEFLIFFEFIPQAKKRNELHSILLLSLVVLCAGGGVIIIFGFLIGVLCLIEAYVYWWMLSAPFFIVGTILTFYLYFSFYQPQVERAKEIYLNNPQ